MEIDMKNKKAVSSVLLIAALLMTACGDTGDNSPVNTSSEQTTSEEIVTTSYLDTLVTESYEGMKFTMLGPFHSARQTFAEDTENGEPVNDALYRRDREIEELFGIEISTILSQDPTGDASKSAMASDDEYQVVIGTMGGTQKSLALKQLSSNLFDFPQLDLYKPWWCEQAVENLTYNGKVFFTTGPITPQFYFAAQVMAYNTRLADNYKLEDIRTCALDGKWTLDKLEKILKDKGNDLDGDGKMTGDDSYGMVFESSVGANAFYVGADQKYCRNDGNNLTVELASDNSISLIERLSAMLTDTDNVYDTYTAPEDINHFVTMFTEGRALFATSSMSHVIVSFREMDDDYVLIPLPKFDENQTEYHTYSNQWCLGGVSVPITVKDKEAVGTILETMAYLSWEYVRPAQYELTLKGKVAREPDEIQAKLLDIIFDCSYYDLNGIFNFGKSVDLVQKAIVGQSTGFVSEFESIKNNIQNDIDAFRKAVE